MEFMMADLLSLESLLVAPDGGLVLCHLALPDSLCSLCRLVLDALQVSARLGHCPAQGAYVLLRLGLLGLSLPQHTLEQARHKPCALSENGS